MRRVSNGFLRLFLFCFLMVLWDQIRAVFFFSHQLKRNGCNRIFSCLFSLSFSPAVRVCVYVIFDTIQMSSRSLRYQILTVSLTTERKPKQKLHFFFIFCFVLLSFSSFNFCLLYTNEAMLLAAKFLAHPRLLRYEWRQKVCVLSSFSSGLLFRCSLCVCVSNSNAKWRTANGWPAAAACLVLHTSTFW